MASVDNNNLTVEQKFAKIMLELRILRPFYSAVYEVMEKIESESCETVGVTTDKMVYNYEFINNCKFDEMVFIMLHEIAHIALMHVARRENRDALLWNVACDFYVNAVLAKEFNLKFPNDSTNINGITIRMPADVLYCSTIDIDEDCAEDMYDKLMQQAKQNGYMQAKGTGSGTGGTFKFTMEGSGEGNGNGNGNGLGSGYYGYNQNVVQNSYKKVDINIKVDDARDLIDKGEDQSEKMQKSNKIVADAAVRVDMSSTGIGSEPGLMEALARKLLNSEINWKRLLKKYLIAATSRDSSFNRPDKRMYYQNAIYPGSIAEDSDEIHGIKVCIDTSGSISDEDLGNFMGQVWQLCKTYKVKAELIYWDASIESTGEFTGYKEFERVNVYGRGGTNPTVVFDYLDSKKCKVKPIVTLMFTDGYFGDEYNKPKYRKKFKDTLWIMTKDHNKQFEPGFGKKALAKFK